MRNFQQLKGGDLLVQTISKYIDLKPDGSEYRACCPFHNEKTPSFTVVPEKGFYHCFGCGAKGDAVDFVQEYEQVDRKQAYDIVAGTIDPGGNKPVKRKLENPKSVYDDLVTASCEGREIKAGEPVKIFNPKRNTTNTVTPSMVFRYSNHGYVIRIDKPDGKITPTVQWCTGIGWTYYHFSEPRPLYGAEDIKPGDRILIVEGEKARDAGKRLLGHVYTVISWPGGTNAVEKADWSELKGRDVLLWPDMDEPGLNAMIGVHTDQKEKPGVADLALEAGAASVRYINWDKRKPKGWDIADAETDGIPKQELIAWAKEFSRDYIPQTSDTMHELSDGDEMLQYYQEYQQIEEQEPMPKNVIQHPAAKEKQWDLDLISNDKGVENNAHNAKIYLENHEDTKGVFAYNAFDDQIYIVHSAPWDDNHSQIPRIIADEDITEAMCWLNGHLQKQSLQVVQSLINVAAKKRSFDPVQNYLKTIEWDGQERIGTWLNRYFGADDTDVHRAIGRKFLIGATARALDPGCKMDNMLILEGSQGIMKSTAVSELFTKDWFADEVRTFESPMELGTALQGAWGVEVPELSAMRKSDTNAVKKALSTLVDRYRPPYGRHVISRPRRCVFIGTVNESTSYLPDMTGNRRYWPVTVRNVDIKGIINDRDQLWAEAKRAYDDGERWWFDYDMDQELIASIEETQEQREKVDSWHEVIDDLTLGASVISYDEIYDKMRIDVAQRKQIDDSRIKMIMKKLGWHYRRKRIANGKRKWLWVKGDQDDMII